MKANYVEFHTRLSTAQVASTFQLAVRKRPLKLRVVKAEFFTPTSAKRPFAAVEGDVAPDFEVGATLEVPVGPDPATGTVILSCVDQAEGTRVLLRSAGNMRGRMFTNNLMGHILAKLTEADPGIRPNRYSGPL